jgi:hypothetical protein
MLVPRRGQLAAKLGDVGIDRDMPIDRGRRPPYQALRFRGDRLADPVKHFDVDALGALIDIDVYVLALLLKLDNFVRVPYLEPLKQKGGFEPRPVKSRHIETDLQVVDVDLDELFAR